MTGLVFAARYVAPGRDALGELDAGALFEAMVPDLLHDGDVDLAMQKAFRWGYQDENGDRVPGLRDVTSRLRDERKQLQDLDADVPDTGEEAAGGMAEAEGDLGNDDGDREQQAHAGRMETLERALRQVEGIDDLRNLDPTLVDTVLSDEERAWVEQWIQMEGRLLDEGFIVEVGDRLELTPRAVRRIGERVLRSLFTRVSGGHPGSHETSRRARIGAAVETSSPWRFGDPFALNLTQTVMNSLRRQGPGGSLALRPDDFEIYDREAQGASATVLLVDMSRSMFYNGCWDAAKRSALALDTLIRTSFDRDALDIVGFSERAERLTLTQLPSLTWNEYSNGTNLQDGLRTARDLLRHHRDKTRQVVLITDGEPTAWMEDGETRFEHPATERVYEATLREVIRCTREGIVINVVLMDDGAAVTEFAERMARMNRGRLIHADVSNLGAFVIRDFMDNRVRRA